MWDDEYEQLANCEHGEDCCGNCLCEDCEAEVTDSMNLFSALENVIWRHRGVGAPRQVVRDRLVYNAIARLGVGENTAIIFDMLWPKEAS